MAFPGDKNLAAAAAIFPGGGSMSSFGRPIVPTGPMAAYASGEYDRTMSEAISAGELDSFFAEIIANAGVQLGGARGQRGGNREELNRNVARIKTAIANGPTAVYNSLIRAAASFTGTVAQRLEVDGLRTALATMGGAGAAGYTVIFGVPEFPALTTALWTFVSMLPDQFLFALLQVLKTFGVAVSFVGAAGSVTLLCVGILAAGVLVYRINAASWEAVGATVSYGAKKISNFARSTGTAFGNFTAYLFGEVVRPVVPPAGPAVVAAAEAAAAAAPAGGAAAAGGGATIVAYKVGVMVIRGPSAKQLAARFSGGDVSKVSVAMSDGSVRPAVAANIAVGGYRRRLSGRKSRHSTRRRKSRRHSKTRRQH